MNVKTQSLGPVKPGEMTGTIHLAPFPREKSFPRSLSQSQLDQVQYSEYRQHVSPVSRHRGSGSKTPSPPVICCLTNVEHLVSTGNPHTCWGQTEGWPSFLLEVKRAEATLLTLRSQNTREIDEQGLFWLLELRASCVLMK